MSVCLSLCLQHKAGALRIISFSEAPIPEVDSLRYVKYLDVKETDA
jgi:hypothetical protein